MAVESGLRARAKDSDPRSLSGFHFQATDQSDPPDHACAFARRLSATFCSVSAIADLRRHANTIVRYGWGRENLRMVNWARRLSVDTAMLGNKVMPAPLETICVSVARLVARN